MEAPLARDGDIIPFGFAHFVDPSSASEKQQPLGELNATVKQKPGAETNGSIACEGKSLDWPCFGRT